MKIVFQITIALFLVSSHECLGQTPLSEDGQSGTGGMVNIGGVLYPEKEMEDPAKRKKAELTAKRVEQLKKAEERPLDCSKLSSDEIFRQLLTSSGGGAFWKAGVEELAKRPDDAKKLIGKILSKKEPLLYEFGKLPVLAGTFGKDYQVEVTKKIIFHPAIRKYDKWFIGQGELLRYLEGSSNDETLVLDRLAEEGRIVRGSEMDLKWRRRLAGGNRKGKRRPEKIGPQGVRNHGRKTEANQDLNSESESSPNWGYLALGGGVVFGLGSLLLIFKTRKGKSACHAKSK